MKILIIDGDEAIRLGAAEILAMKGLEADTAADGREAAALMASGKVYGAVIAAEDLRLPGGTKVIRLTKPYTARELTDAATERR